jgi:hypothetical protein
VTFGVSRLTLNLLISISYPSPIHRQVDISPEQFFLISSLTCTPCGPSPFILYVSVHTGIFEAGKRR